MPIIGAPRDAAPSRCPALRGSAAADDEWTAIPPAAISERSRKVRRFTTSLRLCQRNHFVVRDRRDLDADDVAVLCEGQSPRCAQRARGCNAPSRRDLELRALRTDRVEL